MRWKLEEKTRKIRNFVWEVQHLNNKSLGEKRAGEREGNYEENNLRKLPRVIEPDILDRKVH